jgi:hypothetical protein
MRAFGEGPTLNIRIPTCVAAKDWPTEGAFFQCAWAFSAGGVFVGTSNLRTSKYGSHDQGDISRQSIAG